MLSRGVGAKYRCGRTIRSSFGSVATTTVGRHIVPNTMGGYGTSAGFAFGLRSTGAVLVAKACRTKAQCPFFRPCLELVTVGWRASRRRILVVISIVVRNWRPLASVPYRGWGSSQPCCRADVVKHHFDACSCACFRLARLSRYQSWLAARGVCAQWIRFRGPSHIREMPMHYHTA